MFILRKITGQAVEMNFSLGKSYTLVTAKANPEEFEKLEAKFPYGAEVYGYVSDQDGKFIPLSKNHNNFIMTEGGKTFAKI